MQKNTFNQLLSCRTKNIEHAPRPSTHENVYILIAIDCIYIYVYVYEMQISWQAQRFVKLEVQILCGNLGRASKPKSHPGRFFIESFFKLVSKTKKTPDQRVLPSPFYKNFL